MKRMAVISLLALASLLVASTAFAGQPSIERFPVDDTLVDDVDCSFPVQIRIKGTDIGVTGIVQGDVHDFHAFAGGHAILTNLDTGKTISVNIAGPLHFTFGEDGSFRLVGTGPALFFFEDTPGLQWVPGRFVVSIDAEGNSTFTRRGTSRDLCATLDA
jgi:hypothetical protein